MPRPFTRLARAEATPGHCLRCPRNEDLIDLGADDLGNYGVAYLCTVCLGELLNAMGVVTAEQHEASVLAISRQRDVLAEELADARSSANPGVELITATMEEFANGLDDLARAAVRRLAAGPVGDGGLPAGAADPAEPRVDDVPVEAAGDVDGGDEEPGAADAAAALLADLVGAGRDVVVPADADGAGDAASVEHGYAGDGLDVLYGEPAE